MDADQFGELCGDMEQSGIRCEFGAAAASHKRKVDVILIDDSDGEPAVSQCDVGDSRPGPSSLKELYQWPARFLKELVDHIPRSLDTLRENLSLGLVHEEDFAGCAGMHVACQYFLESVKSDLNLPQDSHGVRHFSVSDNSSNAVKALQLLPDFTNDAGPEHIFKNIFEKLPKGIRSEVVAIHNAMKANRKKTKQLSAQLAVMLKRASSSSVGETPDIVETRALIGETHNTSTVLLAKADMVLSTLTKEALAEVVVTCYRCDHKRGQGKPKCPSCFNGEAASSSASSSASPAVGPVSFLGAGSVCVAHSPMGDRQGLYHESAIVLMTWLHILRARRIGSTNRSSRRS